MTRGQAWTLHMATLLVGGTGIVYGVMIYLMEPVDEFAVVNHAWQPTLRQAHILLAPLLVFGVGWIWQAHVWARVRSRFRPHRRTGLVLVASLLPMVLSGYALQVCEGEFWRNLWVWTHAITSGLWVVFAVIHPWLPVQRTKSS